MEQKIIFKSKHINPEDAQIYGEELIKISNSIGLTPENVIEQAKSKSNPLHDYFEWDNSLASEKWRKQQARFLINEISWVIEKQDYKTKEVTFKITPAFESVNVINESGESNKEYKPIYEIMNQEDLRRQVLSNAIREIDFWQNKYRELRELTPIFNVINKTKKKFKQ